MAPVARRSSKPGSDPSKSDQSADSLQAQLLCLFDAKTGFDELESVFENVFDRPPAAIEAQDAQGLSFDRNRPISQQVPGIASGPLNFNLDDLNGLLTPESAPCPFVFY
ncbi:MAG: hypothetical protein ACUVSX_10875 [Aggregatilineales bacterium]